MVRKVLLGICLWGGVCLAAPEDTEVLLREIQSFTHDLTHFYCSSGWICKAFSQMSAPVFVLCWQQVAGLIGAPEQRWFYAHENDLAYAHCLTNNYRTYEDFMRDSIEVKWLEQCADYHTFIDKYWVDGDLLVEKNPDIEKSPDFDRSRYVDLSEIVWGAAADATAAFYSFYFECLINAMYKKLAFIEPEKDSAWLYLASVLQDKQTLKRIYTICVHQNKQLSPERSREFAYHYRRADEVLATVLFDIVQRAKF